MVTYCDPIFLRYSTAAVLLDNHTEDFLTPKG